jgi:polyphosphate kinase 2 (PPK2 family)
MAKPTLQKRLAVEPGEWGYTLESRDPANTLGLDRKRAEREIEDSRPELLDRQTRIYADSRRAVLIVLQGMDTCGKDGTIKHVIGYFNPVDVHITNFKQPTEVERRHHFLRRNQRGAPGTGPDRHLQPLALRGRAVARVDGLAPEKVIERRYGEINRFEKELEAAGTTVLKFCLHIS